MKGFVPTPEATVDSMVERMFDERSPVKTSRVLDPGCGHGAFIEGVLRWCKRHDMPVPSIVGVELDRRKLSVAGAALSSERRVSLVRDDFLTCELGKFDYIIGNPPYVPIEDLSQRERSRYRKLFKTANGRLDLYLLFWERALELLKPKGRIVFITPEKYIYVETGRPLREILSQYQVEDIVFIRGHVSGSGDISNNNDGVQSEARVPDRHRVPQWRSLQRAATFRRQFLAAGDKSIAAASRSSVR